MKATPSRPGKAQAEDPSALKERTNDLLKEYANKTATRADANVVQAEQERVQSSLDSMKKQPNLFDQAEAAEKSREDIAPPRLDPEELRDIAQMQMLIGTNELQVRQQTLMLENARRTFERNEQLEKRLKPISVRDLLFNDNITQDVKVTDDYYMTFITTGSDLEIIMEVAVDQLHRELLEEMADEKGKPAKASTDSKTLQRTWIHRVVTLLMGLRSLCGGVTKADAIREATDSAVQLNLIKTEARKLMKRPVPVLEDLMNHHTMFVARVRKTMNHAGYIAQESGKSSETPSGSPS